MDTKGSAAVLLWANECKRRGRKAAGEYSMQRHIAIVEDEATIRHNYEDALRRYGYHVSGYGGRADTLAAFSRR